MTAAAISTSRAREIFHDALERFQAHEWPAFLDSACHGDEVLRRQVERLLAAHGQLNSFMGEPAAGSAATIDQPQELIGTWIGPYKLLEQIGEGGMGLVYMAEQQQPVRRVVALKIIKPGMDSRQVVARFEAERQALAMMEHPNIARIYEAGTTGQSTKSQATSTKQIPSTKSKAQNEAEAPVSSIDPSDLRFVCDLDLGHCDLTANRPYFVMELVRGIPINEFCDQQRLPIRQRLELLIQVCQAVQHAHQKGIIHRDLKPTNVLVTMHDTLAVPKVIDFGIAKALGQSLTDHTLHTGFSQLVGTPLYMSPEQAQMNQLGVDTRSDVYSLGVLLYELLTGTTPFDQERLKSAGFDEMRRIIREEEPETVSRRIARTLSEKPGVDAWVNRRAHAATSELDWIVSKSLEKDRSRRYESASALAADLQRYLDGEPVLACPPTTIYRFRKFASKHKPALAAAAAIAICLLLGTTVSAWQAIRATAAEAQATSNEAQAKAAAAAEAQQRSRAEANEQKANAERDEVKSLADRLQRTLYVSNMNLARHTLEAGNGAGRVRELLEQHRPKPGESDLRGFEWFYLHRRSNGALLTIKDAGQARYSADGKRLLSFNGKAWDAQTGQLIYDIGQEDRVAFSTDGTRLASISIGGRDEVKQVTVWDGQTGHQLLAFQAPETAGRSSQLAFSYDNHWLAIASRDRTTGVLVTIRDAQTGEQARSINGQIGEDIGYGFRVVFSADGKRLATSSGQMGQLGEVKMWDAETGVELLDFRGGGALEGVTFSADSKLLASRDGKQVKVWNTQTGRELLTLQGHARDVEYVAISPDGKRLASASYDQTVKIWDTASGKELRSLTGHTGGARKVVFSPDGQRIASRDERNVKIWDVQTGRRLLTFEDIGFGYGSGMSFSPDGKRVVVGYRDSTVRMWDAAADPKPLTIQTGASEDTNVAFSPDGKRVAGAAANNAAKIWDAKSGRVLSTLSGHTERVACVAFSPDGKRLATGSWSRRFGEVKVWDSQTGQQLLTLKGHTEGIYSVAFSPDGKLLASGSTASNVQTPFPGTTDGEAKIWNTETGKEIRSFRVNSNCVVFSPDGKRLASGSGTHVSIPHETKVWDIETGRELLVLQGHNRGVMSVAYSPDGKLIASASGDYTGDNTVKLWDASTGQELLMLDHVVPELTSIAFSPDGSRLASCSSDKTIKLWDVESGQELLTLKGHTAGVDNVAFSPTGHLLASASGDGTIKIWDATPMPAKP